MRIDEIEARKAEIKELINTDGAEFDVDALTEEVRSLDEEATAIREANKKEMELRNKVDESVKNEILRNKEKEKMEEVRTFGIDTVEYREAWLKNLQGKELSVEERGAVSASSAIPTITMNEIIHKLEQNPLLAAVDMTYIPGNVTFPTESSCGDASWTTGASNDSEDALGSVSLAAYKLIKTVEIGADVKAMAIDAFESYITSRLANKIEKAIDAGIISGGGSASNQCEGIKKAKNNAADSTWDSTGLTWKNLTAIMGSLGSAYAQNATFVMHRELFYGQVLGMTDTQKNRVVCADAQSPAKFNVIGYPVILDDNMATNELFFGDLKAYKFNFAQAPEVKSDDSVGFRSGSKVYRGMALADGKLSVTSAIKYCKQS